MKTGRAIVLLTMWLLLQVMPASACSVVSCLDKGVEVRPVFTVKIRHGDRPLARATVEITGQQGTSHAKGVVVTTDKDGIARITNLAPGAYWLQAKFLGIDAAYHCFHVNEKPSGKAKGKLAFDWGDLAPATRRIAGRLLDSQPGKSGTPIQNLLHRVDMPIAEAKLKLQNATTGAAFSATSDANGSFALDGVPAGTYVLRIEAGRVGPDREYEASDLLIALRPSARRDSLIIRHREAGGGSCGGMALELQDSPEDG